MEKKHPLVSCITTTYNKFQYFFKTLDSIFEQDYPNIELIISDDGSDNYPKKEIEEYVNANKKDNIKRIIYNIHKHNYGTVKNSNINRSLASGKYFFGIGSDDFFCDEKVISDIVDFFERTQADIVTCRRRFISEDGKKEFGSMPFKSEEKYFEKLTTREQFERIASFNYISGASTYLRAESFKQWGGFDEDYKYFEDYPMYLKLLRNNNSIHYYPRESIYYRFGSGQSTVANKKNELKAAIYNERILAIEKDILPYCDGMKWWRVKHIRTKLLSYQYERDCIKSSLISKYMCLMRNSFVGTIIHIYYQLYYKVNLKIT